MAGKKRADARVTSKSKYWGGAREGSGPKLSPYKTRYDIQKLMTQVKRHLDNGNAVDLIDPMLYWTQILNNLEEPNARRDMAASQIAMYCIPKPKPVDSMGNSDNHLVIEIQHQGSPTITYSANHAPSLALPQPVIDVEMDDDD